LSRKPKADDCNEQEDVEGSTKWRPTSVRAVVSAVTPDAHPTIVSGGLTSYLEEMTARME
jgi:hypothetical protein